MVPSFPPGDPWPADGALPAAALDGMASRTFSVYLHVPFCRVRCGYCDFNTYTLPELGDDSAPRSYLEAAHAELDLAARVLADGDPPPVSTVFVGGGTPTLLDVEELAGLVGRIPSLWSLEPDAEVTTEANPDTITPQVARALADAGFTRVSLGMQSAVPHVLATLDRTHDPANVARAVDAVRGAGMQVSLDLIHGTPGESLTDWERSLTTVVDLAPDHVSAYALTIEEGTRMHARVRRGELPAPEDDDQADKYELADAVLADAGYRWYEISNWARTEDARCRHNLAYWRGGDWWGIGPGAHSHVGGLRWWNVKHPRAHAQRLAAGRSPAHAGEVLDADQRHDELVLLGARLVEGLDVAVLSDRGRSAVAGLIADGLVEGREALRGRAVLTLRGRLLADTVVHRLLGA